MEPRKLAHGGHELEYARAMVRLWTPSSRMVVGQFSGHLPTAMVAPLVDVLDRVIDDPARALIFFEASGVTGYEPAVRAAVTKYLLDHRPQIAHFRILVGSKILAMGVSVANLVLGGLAESYSDPAKFARDLDATLSGTPMSSAALALTQQRRAART